MELLSILILGHILEGTFIQRFCFCQCSRATNNPGQIYSKSWFKVFTIILKIWPAHDYEFSEEIFTSAKVEDEFFSCLFLRVLHISALLLYYRVSF